MKKIIIFHRSNIRHTLQTGVQLLEMYKFW